MKRIVIGAAFAVLFLYITGCSVPEAPVERGLKQRETVVGEEEESQPPLESEASQEIKTDYKHILLTENNLATNDEVLQLFIHLLEEGKALTEEELAKIQMEDDYSNVWYTWYFYSQRGLDTLDVEVLGWDSLGSRSTNGLYNEFKEGENYAIQVNVASTGALDIPLGKQEWVLQTKMPIYGFASLTPDTLISSSEYLLREKCAEYTQETDIIRGFISFGPQGAFNGFTAIPHEELIHHIVYTQAHPLTQEELDSFGDTLFGIEHLSPENSPLYNPDTKLYDRRGYGPPYPYDRFFRVNEDSEGLHFDYVDFQGISLRYTMKDGRVIKSEDISAEVLHSDYGEVQAKNVA